MTASWPEIVGEFIEEASWTARAKAIATIASRYLGGSLDEAEKAMAAEIFRIALYDGEKLVRRVLAESVKRIADMPRDIVLALAQDVPEVSVPLIEASPVLAEADLLAIASDGTTAQRLAAAARRPLPAAVADALCLGAATPVLYRLLANDEAAIGEATLDRLLDAYRDQPAVAEAIIARRRFERLACAGV